jgi:hypothetical protein
MIVKGKHIVVNKIEHADLLSLLNTKIGGSFADDDEYETDDWNGNFG